MRRGAAIVVALAACSSPAPASDPTLEARIDELARSFEPPGETADLASAIALARTDESLPAARDYLVTWATAHGGLVPDDEDATANSSIAVLHIVRRFSDDATLDAAVYFTTRLRRQGTTIMALAFAALVETKLVALRPVADPKWRASRVRDDELDRLMASEVASHYAFARAHGERDTASIDAFAAGVLAAHDLARACGQSAAALYRIELIVQRVGRGVDPFDPLQEYVARWTAAQLAYNAWLDR